MIEESERVITLTRLQVLAEECVRRRGISQPWLRDSLGILDGMATLEVAGTHSGARLIEQLLAKIDWGAAA